MPLPIDKSYPPDIHCCWHVGVAQVAKKVSQLTSFQRGHESACRDSPFPSSRSRPAPLGSQSRSSMSLPLDKCLDKNHQNTPKKTHFCSKQLLTAFCASSIATLITCQIWSDHPTPKIWRNMAYRVTNSLGKAWKAALYSCAGKMMEEDLWKYQKTYLYIWKSYNYVYVYVYVFVEGSLKV